MRPPIDSTAFRNRRAFASGATNPGAVTAGAAVWTPPGGPVECDDLTAAHLRGPRFIMHVLDHLLSPVANVVPDPRPRARLVRTPPRSEERRVGKRERTTGPVM